MTKEQHEKLADFYYAAYQAATDDYIKTYCQDMMLWHEMKSKRYTKEYTKG